VIVEIFDRYGPTAFFVCMIMLVMISTARYINQYLEWRRTHHARSLFKAEAVTARWAVQWPEKAKRKRKRQTPEQRYYARLKAIADAEARPHAVIGDNVQVVKAASDYAQMRDLAYQEYLRDCAVRQARAMASVPRLVQIVPNEDDYSHLVIPDQRGHHDTLR